MREQELRLAPIQRIEKRWNALRDVTGERALNLMAEWIRAQVAFFGAKGCTIGVSGGVDSTLVTAVLTRALPADQVHALVMPHRNSDPADEREARALLKVLGLKPRVFRLDDGIDGLLGSMGIVPDDAPKRHVGNLAGRSRVGLQYYVASVTNTIVVGTGDIDEVFIGFASPGVGADLYPITGLHKDEVRSLAYAALSPYGRTLARRLAERPASPGYWRGQKSEEQIGIPYSRVGRAVDAIQLCSFDRRGVYPPNVDAFVERLAQSGVDGADFEVVVDQLLKNFSLIGGAPALFRPERARPLPALTKASASTRHPRRPLPSRR
jgi:NAD+ synthase